MNAVTDAFSEENVQEVAGIVRSTDWRTGLAAVAILLIGLAAVRLISIAVKKGLNRSHIPPTLHAILRTMIRIVLDLAVILAAANYIGIPTTSFIALLGLAGLTLSLALQGILSNLASSFIILASHPFKVGDYVEHEGVAGTVREIRMQHTRLETVDGRMVYVPNSSISAARVINYSETGLRRIDISFSASYGNTPEQVRKAALAAVAEVGAVLPEPKPVVALEDYGPSDIRYTLYVWVQGEDFLPAKRALTEGLYGAFAAHGVEMSYPHLNVHMK